MLFIVQVLVHTRSTCVTLGQVNQMRLRVVFICTSLTLRSTGSELVNLKAAVARQNCQLVNIKATVGLFENLSLSSLIT